MSTNLGRPASQYGDNHSAGHGGYHEPGTPVQMREGWDRPAQTTKQREIRQQTNQVEKTVRGTPTEQAERSRRHRKQQQTSGRCASLRQTPPFEVHQRPYRTTI